MNLVLLIGNNRFTASVIAQVRGLDVLTVMTAAHAIEAAKIIEETMPDVIIIHAGCLIETSVVRTFGEISRSVFFIVLEEPSQWLTNTQHRQTIPLKDGHTAPSIAPVETMDVLSELYTEKKIAALEGGADVYIWLLSQKPPPLLQLRTSQCRLIQAYIHTALSRAQRYRDLSRINDWLSAVALVDALTQLSNRRAFDLELPQQVQVSRKKGTPTSLIVLDIDYFKSVNDRYGHLVGDDVLKQLAKRLLANMRFYDTPFRYGGEEFVIILNNTDLAEAQAIAERLRHSIDSRAFELTHLLNEPILLEITASIGLTELQAEDDEQGQSFLNRADQYLLKAKATGRNRIVSG